MKHETGTACIFSRVWPGLGWAGTTREAAFPWHSSSWLSGHCPYAAGWGRITKSFAVVVIVTLSCMMAAEVWRIWRNNALKKSGGFDTVGRNRIVKNITFLFK